MSDPFFKGKRIFQILIVSVVALIVICITIVLILFFAGNTPGKIITKRSEYTHNSGLLLTDFYLDEELESFFQKKMYPLRDRSSGWSKEEINRFFIPVEEILYEYFKKKNDNYIKEIFSNID